VTTRHVLLGNKPKADLDGVIIGEFCTAGVFYVLKRNLDLRYFARTRIFTIALAAPELNLLYVCEEHHENP